MHISALAYRYDLISVADALKAHKNEYLTLESHIRASSSNVFEHDVPSWVLRTAQFHTDTSFDRLRMR